MKMLMVLFAFVISLFSVSSINAQELTELVKYDKEKNMLVFQDKESLAKVYTILNEKHLKNRAFQSETEEEVDEVDEDSVLKDFGKSVGFYEQSLRYIFLLSEIEQLERGAEPEEIVRPKVRNYILQALLNENYAVQIGNEIVLIFSNNSIVMKEYDETKMKELVAAQVRNDTEKVSNNNEDISSNRACTDCCDRDVFLEIPFEYEKGKKRIICQIDSDQNFISPYNVNAEMWYYERSGTKWKKKNAKLNARLWGNVLGTDLEGDKCKCKIKIPVDDPGVTAKNAHKLYTNKVIKTAFGHRKSTGEWGADFMVNDVLITTLSSNLVIKCP